MSDKVVHLNRYVHFTRTMRDPAIELGVSRYVSRFDGSMQSVLAMSARARPSARYFVFLHGMDGDAGDAVIVHDLVAEQGGTVIAPGGRGPCWLSAAFVADSLQVVEEHIPAGRTFVLIGVSMGGTQALALPGLWPTVLQQRLEGVIAVIPGADLAAIVARSSEPRVRATLLASVGGDPLELGAREPKGLVDRYPPGLALAIVRRADDTLLLAPELDAFIRQLRTAGHPVADFCQPGEHEFTPTDFDYGLLLDALGKDTSWA